jgi:hypothetical protein
MTDGQRDYTTLRDKLEKSIGKSLAIDFDRAFERLERLESSVNESTGRILSEVERELRHLVDQDKELEQLIASARSSLLPLASEGRESTASEEGEDVARRTRRHLARLEELRDDLSRIASRLSGISKMSVEQGTLIKREFSRELQQLMSLAESIGAETEKKTSSRSSY